MKEGVDDITAINTNTIFLKIIGEKELTEVVYNFKNKKSTDCNDTDMTLVKKYYSDRVYS